MGVRRFAASAADAAYRSLRKFTPGRSLAPCVGRSVAALAILFLPGALFAKPLLELKPDAAPFEAGIHTEWLASEDELAEAFVLSEEADARFRSSEGDRFNFGLSEADYWFRLRVRNDSQAFDWLLHIDRPLLGEVRFLRCPPEGTCSNPVRMVQGAMYPFERRHLPTRDFVFPLELAPGEAAVYFLRIRSEEPIQFHPRVLRGERFFAEERTRQMLTGLYFGVFIGMLLYNLLLFAMIRERIFVYYLAFLSTTGFFLTVQYGVAAEYFFPDMPAFARDLNVHGVGLVIVATVPFVREILNLRRLFPGLNRLLLVFFWAGLAQALIGAQIGFRAGAALALGLVFAFLIAVFCACAVAARARHRPAALVLIAWALLLVGGLIYVLKTGGFLPYNPWTNYGLLAGSAAEMTLMSIALGYRINELRRETRGLEAAQRRTQSQLDSLEQELAIARRLQLSLLPERQPRTPGLRIGVVYEPWIAVGGDLYDYHETDPDGAIAILIADAAGHGIGAALTASMTRVAFAEQHSVLSSPALALRRMNKRLSASAVRNGAFVTAAIVHLDVRTGALRYASAGHPPLVLQHASGEAEMIEHFGPVLGWRSDHNYVDRELSLRPGARIWLHTDGLTEAVDSRGDLFGDERLLEGIRRTRGADAQEACRFLLEVARGHGGSDGLCDDGTVLAVDFLDSSAA